MKEEIIRIQNASDSKLLKCIYFSVYRSEILGVIFANMQERQGLIDILSGEEKFSDGRIYHMGERVTASHAQHTYRNNCVVIENKSNLIDHMTVSENVCVIGNEAVSFFIGKTKYEEKTRLLFDRFNVNIPAGIQVKKLSLFEKVVVTLLKAYSLGKAVVLLKDITGFLNRREIESVMQLIRRLKEDGLSFIIFETYEDILFEYADTFLIAKNGKTAGIFQSEELDKQRIYSILTEERMAGGLQNAAMQFFSAPKKGGTALRFHNVCTEVLEKINLEVRRGEIAKLLYLDYTSGEHIVELLKGERQAIGGNIYLNEENFRKPSFWGCVSKGICFVEENPFNSMLFYEMDVLDNICFSMSKKVVGMWTKSSYRKSVENTMENILGKDSLHKPLSDLSPVELQKVVYCKWLLYAPNIVVCIKPFSGVDVQVRQVTEQMIRLLTERGIAVLIVTSNNSEIDLIEGDFYIIQNGKFLDEEKARHKTFAALKDKL